MIISSLHNRGQFYLDSSSSIGRDTADFSCLDHRRDRSFFEHAGFVPVTSDVCLRCALVLVGASAARPFEIFRASARARASMSIDISRARRARARRRVSRSEDVVLRFTRSNNFVHCSNFANRAFRTRICYAVCPVGFFFFFFYLCSIYLFTHFPAGRTTGERVGRPNGGNRTRDFIRESGRLISPAKHSP